MNRPRQHLALTAGESPPDPERAVVSPGQWLRLLASAAARRKHLALLVFAAGASAVTAYFMHRTPLYRVETRVLAQRQQALPSAVRTAYQENPAYSAWETVHKRENLLAVAGEVGLVTRPAAIAPGEAAHVHGEGHTDTDEVILALDKHLHVETEEGTITIWIEWHDPVAAYEIVRAALRNFLEARHVQEITAIDEVMSVLQGRTAAAREALDAAVEDARRRSGRPAPRAPAPVTVRPPSEELIRLQSLLEARQRAIRDLEELRLRRIAELQAQLEQARTAYSEAHPTLIGLRRDLEAASRESPQIEQLRVEEDRLRRDYAARLARERPGTVTAPAEVASPPPPSPEDDPRVQQARLEYEQMVSRLHATQIELESARAAFKYRYNVVWPPQRPGEPVSPSPRKIFGAGLLASLFLALAAAAAPDLLRGRILQRWQIERGLELPVLGEIRRP